MKRSRYKIPKWLKTEWPQVASPPYPDKNIQKIMHSMWLPVFLVTSILWHCLSFLITIASFLIDGPIRPSWKLSTALTHSILQTAMQQYVPQGRHSMFLVRLFTSVRIPSFLFPKCSIANIQISISNSQSLSKVVADMVHIKTSSDTLGPRVIKGEWLKFNKNHQSNTVILYLHGGAHIFLSSKSHRTLTVGLARAAACEVLAIDYRLAPENRFPAAVEDALAAYCYLTNQTLDGILQLASHKYNVILVGDSSGACLCLQLAFLLKKLDLKMPEGLVLISPFVDHTITSPSWHFNWNSDFMNLDVRGIVWALSLYSNGLPLNHSVLSPVNMNLEGFPPLLIQVGDAEVLYNDAEHLFKSALLSGILVKLEIYEDMFHVFQAFSFISESQYAMNRMGDFIKKLISQEKTPGEELVTRIRNVNGKFIERVDIVGTIAPQKRSKRDDQWKDFNLESFL